MRPDETAPEADKPQVFEKTGIILTTNMTSITIISSEDTISST
jgi:hypothetical protein